MELPTSREHRALTDWEIATQLEVIRLAEGQDADALTRIADLSGALRDALLVVAAQAVGRA
ncbi:hypothetical protein [Lentzea cavernae]|nr:hypothetical protein [Lentzea cavernae]